MRMRGVFLADSGEVYATEGTQRLHLDVTLRSTIDIHVRSESTSRTAAVMFVEMLLSGQRIKADATGQHARVAGGNVGSAALYGDPLPGDFIAFPLYRLRRLE